MSGLRMWTDKGYREQSLSIAWLNPNSDHRDLTIATRRFMMMKRPDIFKVDDAILKDPRTKLGFAASEDGIRSALRPYVGVPAPVISGLSSVDPKLDEVKHWLAVHYSKTFKPNIDPDGFADYTAVTRDFSAMLTATGVKASAANAPPTNRVKMLEEAGIAQNFVSERHARIFKAMHKIIFARRRHEAPMSFQVRSSSTMPTWYRGQGSQFQKQSMIHHLGNNLHHIFDMLEKDDIRGLYEQYELYFGMKLVERAQSEGVKDLLSGDYTPKPREVADELYALSGGQQGRRFVSSKTDITKDLFGLKYGIGARIRTAYAVCGQINMIVGLFLAGTRAYYLTEGAYTWHHTTPEAIYQDIKEYEHVIGMDVKTMDQFYPKFLLDLHASLIGEYYDRRFGKLISYINGLPYYAPQLAMGAKPFWAGDPRDPSTFTVDPGLSSGRTDNPDLGKWYMTSTYMCLADDVVGGVLELGVSDEESVMAVLKGLHPKFGIKDMSDDALIGFKKGFEQDGRRLRQLVVSKEKEGGSASPYAVLSLENGIAFLGNVILKDELGNVARPKPNPVTFMVNRYCPERGINSLNRQYWAHGMMAALEHYSRAGSIITEMLKIEREAWKTFLPEYPTPEQTIADVVRQQRLPINSILSPADIEVLLDPTKLYYKFDPSEVSPDIARLFTASIDGKTVDKYIKPFI